MRLTLAALRLVQTESFPALLERLHKERFTGEVLLCFGQGHPKAAKFVKTTEIRLDSGANESRVDSQL